MFLYECNRIVGYDRWELSDRFDVYQSQVMVSVWLVDRTKKNPNWGVKELARAYRWGEAGAKKNHDTDYEDRVGNLYKEKTS